MGIEKKISGSRAVAWPPLSKVSTELLPTLKDKKLRFKWIGKEHRRRRKVLRYTPNFLPSVVAEWCISDLPNCARCNVSNPCNARCVFVSYYRIHSTCSLRCCVVHKSSKSMSSRKLACHKRARRARAGKRWHLFRKSICRKLLLSQFAFFSSISSTLSSKNGGAVGEKLPS